MLWALSAVIVLLASHVMLGWVRQAQAVAAERRHWFAVAMAAAAFGTALSAAVALSLSGEALAFPVGYQRLSALGIWLGSVALLVPAAALLAFWPSLLASLAAGVLIGALATLVEAGWVTAAGFRPGVIWNRELLLASWLVCSTGFSAAFALGFPRAERAQHYRYSWRIAAAALMALSFVGSLALVIMGAGLPTQVGSIYRHELSGTTVSLVGGGILPLVLVMMIVDLEVRRRQRRRVRRKRRRDAQASRFATFEMPGDDGIPVQPATHPVYPRKARSMPDTRGLGVPVAAAATGMAAAAHLADAQALGVSADQGLGLEAAWSEAQPGGLPTATQTELGQPAFVTAQHPAHHPAHHPAQAAANALSQEWAQAAPYEAMPTTAAQATPENGLVAAPALAPVQAEAHASTLGAVAVEVAPAGALATAAETVAPLQSLAAQSGLPLASEHALPDAASSAAPLVGLGPDTPAQKPATPQLPNTGLGAFLDRRAEPAAAPPQRQAP